MNEVTGCQTQRKALGPGGQGSASMEVNTH